MILGMTRSPPAGNASHFREGKMLRARRALQPFPFIFVVVYYLHAMSVLYPAHALTLLCLPRLHHPLYLYMSILCGRSSTSDLCWLRWRLWPCARAESSCPRRPLPVDAFEGPRRAWGSPRQTLTPPVRETADPGVRLEGAIGEGFHRRPYARTC